MQKRQQQYAEKLQQLRLMLEDERDWIATLATVACELHHEFAHYDWTGFYRAAEPGQLVIGPYQGSHGCLRIAYGRGVCGAAAQERRTQIIADVSEYPDHIACSAASSSEIVVPVLTPTGELLAVLDVDANHTNAFNECDARGLEQLCQWLGSRPWSDLAVGQVPSGSSRG